MNRTLRIVIAVLSLVLVLVIAATTAFGIVAAKNAGIDLARIEFDHFANALRGVKSVDDLADPLLRERLVFLYKGSRPLLAAIITDQGGRTVWQIPSETPYLSSDRTSLTGPPYSTTSLSAQITGTMNLVALYITLPQSKILLIFRSALIVVGVYAILVMILVLAAGMAKPVSQTGGVPAMPAETPASQSGAVDTPTLVRHVPDDSAKALLDFEYPYRRNSVAGQEDKGTPVSSPENTPEEVDVQALAASPQVAVGESAMQPSVSEENSTEDEASDFSLDPYSPVSGLGRERNLQERLEAEIVRGRSDGSDVSLLMVSYSGLTPEDPLYPAFTSAIKDYFSIRDLVFEYGPGGFALILPNIDVRRAVRLAADLLKSLRSVVSLYREPSRFTPLYMGISAVTGRKVFADRVLREATAAMEKARIDRDSHIVAFNPDPVRFRNKMEESVSHLG